MAGTRKYRAGAAKFCSNRQFSSESRETSTRYTKTDQYSRRFSDELPEDDGTSLEFEIEAEQENQDYELPTVDLLDSIPTVDQSDEYKN